MTRNHPPSRRAAPGPRAGTLCLALALAPGCTFAGGRAPTSDPPPSRADVDRAVSALEQAEAQFDEGRYEVAADRADSLFSAWSGQPALGSLADRALWLSGRAREARGLPGSAAESYERLIGRAGPGRLRDLAVERLTGVLADTGREPEAVALALENPGVLDDVGLEALRQWASALSIDRLRGFATAYAPDTVEAGVVHVALAQLLVAGGDMVEAGRVAEGVLDGGAAEPERQVARLIATAGGDTGGATATIGAILPLTGELAGVGELLREGIELAVSSYREARPQGFALELRVLDDRSNPENTTELVEQLERDGVIAIVGPLRSESFAAAARARRNPRLPIISPTALEVLGPSPGAYTLYDLETRERDVAVDLAGWTVNELGLRRVAVLAPTGVGMAGAVDAFVNALRQQGGDLVGRQSYDPTLTTFQAPVEAIDAAAPDVVFAPAPTTPVVLSVAPQLFYYGLHDAIVLGSAAWADPAVVRRLEAFAANHRVIGFFVDRVSPGTPWQQFVTDYERTYRKSLRNNILPALAYDAVAMLVAALEGGRLPIPAAVSAWLEAGPVIAGVTGELRPDPESSTVRRTTRIRMLMDGALVEVDRSELLNWLAEVRAAPSPFAPRDTLQRDTIPR